MIWYTTPKQSIPYFPNLFEKKKKSLSPLCLGESKRVEWNWCHHLIHSLRSVTLPYATSVIHGPWLIFFIYPLVSPAPRTTASIKKTLKSLLIEWMHFIKKNWFSKALHLVYLFQILFTLPYRNHPNLINPCRCGRIKNLDPFHKTLSPKGFWHLQTKFSHPLRVRNKSRRCAGGYSYHFPSNKFNLLPKSQLRMASKENNQLDDRKWMRDCQSNKALPFALLHQKFSKDMLSPHRLITAVPEDRLHTDYN